MHKEIILPAEFVTDDMSWAKDRANLWNAAESAETRKNARVAREYLVALPVELARDERLNLVREFSRELADRYRFAVDFAIHAPRDFPGSDPRNFHAHLLATTREITIQGLGPKTTLEWNDGNRREIGLGPAINELLHVRQRWAAVTNEALRDAHIDARVDHRTLQAQGIDREPWPHIPRVAFEIERHGYRSIVADRLREQHQARVDARLAAREASKVKDVGAELLGKGHNLEEIRREARESWLRMRQERVESTLSANVGASAGVSSGAAAPARADRARDEDLSR